MNQVLPRKLRRSPVSGFSVVELLVALTLGLLLVAGMIQLFNTSKTTFRTNDALARVQENGRFALEILKRELREAGSHGFCAGRIEIRNHLRTSCAGGAVDLFNANRALVGWEYTGTGAGQAYTLPDDLDPSAAAANEWSSSVATSNLPGLLADLVAPGSDVLVVRRLQVVPGVTASGVTPSNAAAINLTASHGLDDDAIVLVTNCATGADLFQNRNNGNASSLSRGGGSCSNPGPGNLNNGCTQGGQTVSCDWSTDYDQSMQIFDVQQVAYYIGISDTTGQPALFRHNLGNGTRNAERAELIEGAENMQILYGFSEAAPAGDGRSVDRWLTADEVPADGWEQVIALRIALSVRSPEIADLDDAAVTMDLAGTQVTAPGDGRIRQPFAATIALRNRVITL